MWYDLLKTIHILSSTLLFGAGCSTAFHMLWAWRSAETAIVRRAARGVALADWLFTAIPGFVQPASGIGLLLVSGIDPFASWLVVAYALYLIALACWLPVAALQIRIARARGDLDQHDSAAMRRWLCLGWPAFIALVVVFYLMVAKPTLW